jgi:hypothetical protein
MTKAVFEKLESHVFDEGNPWVDIWADRKERPNKLSYFSSWAMYGEDALEGKEVKDIEADVISRLNENIVFVALNFSNPLKTSGPDAWKPWKNIYSNYNLRWLLDGGDNNFDTEKVEKYKGAYITDLIKNIIGSVANKVTRELDHENIDKNIGWFFEEIDLLGSNCIEMYLFGRDVEDLFREHVMPHKEFPKFREKVKKCQEIYHYAGSDPKFRPCAPEQLGLMPSSDPKLINILWNDLE